MSPTDRWRKILGDLDITNVFIYVADAVRWDYLPERISQRGVTCRTIGSSIHSPPSFASIATGCYPTRHGVFGFNDRLSKNFSSLLDRQAHTTRFVNSVRDNPQAVDPIFSVLDAEKPEPNHPFDDIEDPFVVMERGPGGHAPYGTYDGTAWDYFEDRGSMAATRYRKAYKKSIQRDCTAFESRLEELNQRSLENSTLVVYTSDHGELLGEAGSLGHNAPIRPELVSVPTVLVHPSFPAVDISSELWRHVDLFPTVNELLGYSDPDLDGITLTRQESRIPALSFYKRSLSTNNIPGCMGEFAFESAWDHDGGHVFTTTPVHERLLTLIGKLVRSPKRSFLRHNLLSAFNAYILGTTTYGTPGFDRETAREVLRAGKMGKLSQEHIDLSPEAEETLHDLGYL